MQEAAAVDAGGQAQFLTAVAVGVLLGLTLAVLAVVLVRASDRRRRAEQTSEPPLPAVPAGVSDVLAVLRSGAIVLEPSGRVVKASASAVAYGLVRRDDLAHSELRHLVRQVQRDGIIRETELELARGPLGPGLIVVALRVAPIGHDLVLVLVDDRTQARRLEETRRDFVVNVSHELKTPVGGLALLAEAVEDAADDPVAVRRFAHRMKSESTRLTRLVSEIVDLSRLQTTDALGAPHEVDLAACAAEAVEDTRLVAGTRQVSAAATRDRARLQVWGDRALLTTAIRNLVTNAINYSEDGSRVSVVTRRNGDLVEVAVSDQGQGISTADQDRIFERFYRVDPARSRATGGTGLGLSIVKHISANHGGDVTVWSQEGHGSTFTMRLPAADTDQETEPPTRHTVQAVAPAPQPGARPPSRPRPPHTTR